MSPTLTPNTQPPNSRDLPIDHLASTTKDGHRVWLYPADVEGKYRNRRVLLQAILVVFFLVLPWIKIRGNQALLLDLPERRFNIFGLIFWAHDAPMLAFVIGGAAVTLALVTAIWGRLWCGWACPQTVFVDGVFRRIERWIEGKPAYRRMLDQGPWTAEKVFKKLAKWAAFATVTLVITHSFMAYWVGTDDLLKMMRMSPSENPTPFIFMLVMSGIILFDFGWFREQFCIIACPYGRLQSVLMDDHSLVVAYDAKRGEPRKGSAEAVVGQQGDCVNCYRCVQVCPTGVDIRRGVQMECVACTACIDACDDMMTRQGKPKGLIRYDTFLGLQGNRSAGFRIRTLVYTAFVSIAAAGIILLVANRKELDFVLLRAIDAPFQVVGEEVINHFQIDLNNQGFQDLEVRVDPVNPAAQIMTAQNPVRVIAGKDRRFDFFIRVPKDLVKGGHGNMQLKITYTRPAKPELPPVEKIAEIKIVGPLQ